MSEQITAWKKYLDDPRSVCKYGAKCYQKNPDHHKKFKHPLKKRKITDHKSPNVKRFKPDHKSPVATGNEDEKKTVVNDSSESSKGTEDDKKTDVNNSGESSQGTSESVDNLDKQITIQLPEDVKFYDKSKDWNIIIKDKFLIDMPEDFYKFHECLNENNDISKLLASVNLELIGPYDLLMGNLPILEDNELYLIHWRFFFDPPEFQAILKRKGKSEYHIGYFRDAPNESPVFLASNDSSKDCKITPIAYNVFGAVYIFLQNEKKQSPFISIACQKLMDRLKKYAEQNDFSIEEYNIKKRLTQSVTKTFHGAGIVVPYNKKTQLGYRPLVETDVKLRSLFKQLETASTQKDKDKILSELQPVITYANIAVDECDFGTGLEAGIDLFTSGLAMLEASALSTLCAVYSLLNRDAFSKIIQAHLKYRRRGPNMSIMAPNS